MAEEQEEKKYQSRKNIQYFFQIRIKPERNIT